MLLEKTWYTIFINICCFNVCMFFFHLIFPYFRGISWKIQGFKTLEFMENQHFSHRWFLRKNEFHFCLNPNGSKHRNIQIIILGAFFKKLRYKHEKWKHWNTWNSKICQNPIHIRTVDFGNCFSIGGNALFFERQA